jgi:catechol 2,3-dioxygenase-like lactoylglutathione lyase family enzyme
MLRECYGRDATIRQMSSSHSPFWTNRSLPRLDRQDPYLSLHFVIIFVRDQERSLRFYLDQLGFRLVVDHRFESGDRWIEVAPPDGSANLALIPAKPNSKEYTLIGRDNQVFFLTEDVTAKFNEWSKRGVRFQFPPQEPTWGGIFTRFEDVDGNSFGLAGFDEVRRGVEAQRHALAEKLESERSGGSSPYVPTILSIGIERIPKNSLARDQLIGTIKFSGCK